MSLRVEEWPIDRLVPYARNPRKNDAVVAKMVSAIREFGFRIPIVAKSDGSIVDGHLRYKAAQEMGLQTVPVALADELTETQVKAFRLLANRSANWAEWDDDLLKLELEELQAEDFPIDIIGFEPEEIAFSEESSQDNTDKNEDNIPELLPGIISQTGDVWICREHRIMCGDSTNLDNITILMKGHKANLCLTDPPYGVKRDKGFDGKRVFSGGKGKRIPYRRYEDDDWDSKTPDKKTFENILNNSAQAIIFGGNFLTDKLPCNGFWIVWDKHNSMPTFGDCELAWTNIKRNSVKKYDVLYNGLIGKEKERFHPTQKPVKLFTSIIQDFTREGDLVLDLFAGSGTTLLACEQCKRICYAMELYPKYCDVIIRRWQDFTGEKAFRESDGATFDLLSGV